MRPDAVQYARALRPPYHLLSFLRIKGKSTKGKSCTDKNTMVRRNVCSLKFLPSLHSKQISVSLAYELQPTLFYPIICSSWKDCSRIFFKLNSSVYWFTPLDCCLVSLTIGDFSQQLKKTLSVIYPIIYLLQFYSKMSTNLNDVTPYELSSSWKPFWIGDLSLLAKTTSSTIRRPNFVGRARDTQLRGKGSNLSPLDFRCLLSWRVRSPWPCTRPSLSPRKAIPSTSRPRITTTW